MILEFKCSNFRSINKEITFSMQAAKDDTLSEQLINFDTKNFLRTSFIYGPNGSGKTTLLRAINRMANLVGTSYRNQPGDELAFDPHKLNQDNPTHFSMWFEKNGIKYFYEIKYTSEKIIEENLYYSPNGRLVEIFERDDLTIEFGNTFEKDKGDCENQLKENKLLLSVAANITKIEPIDDAFRFFREDIVFFDALGPMWRRVNALFIEKDTEFKKLVVKFMTTFCPGLKDINVKIERRNVSEDEQPELFENRPSRYYERIIVTVIYEEFSVDLRDESSGIQKIFDYICPVLKAVSSGNIFLCDEIERSLHPKVVEELVKFFTENKTNNAQGIFTTHDVELMDPEIVRRDQIWFAKLNADGRETDLYSLTDLNDVRKGENIRKGYLEDRYGALPSFPEED